ncbi:thiamine pyrophosphokinase 1 isoform X2 [Megalopta genalis]|uniref:thiamine pyrophosphokinase 1 isoform X2 n=1 Tax=Megalopta genalis TaxID=115081 RepID=UPI003FD4C874
MKTEVSWKRRFLRKKFKYTLICVFVVAIIFVVHQLFYFKQLNQAVVEKLTSESVRTSKYNINNKILDKVDTLRGTRDKDQLKYLPNSEEKFVCFISKTEIDFVKINDDYCDCPEDGSDEPSTNACNNGVFYCQKSSSQVTLKISSYKVNDGVCDCCDGSDEWAEVKLSHSGNDIFRKYKLSLIMQSNTNLSISNWDPLQIFQSCSQYKYAIVILNRPLRWNSDILLRIWENAQIKITVDGGTHRWLQYLEAQDIDLLDGKHSQYLPNLITGDMDSCSPEILEKLKSVGTRIIKTPDQNYTDYTKALLQMEQYASEKNINLEAIYVFVDSSGRLDHTFANINTLFLCNKLIAGTKIIHIANDSLTWILKPGFHSISIPEILVQTNSWCGLLPIGSPVKHISTTGLKWNLDNATIQFGEMVSTSNTYDNCSNVTIKTDSLVVWTMGIKSLKEKYD